MVKLFRSTLGPAMLKDCLDSISSQTQKPTIVYVVDQSDNTETFEVCKNYDVEYYHKEFKNKSKAVNFGISIAKTSHISIIDDDTILYSDWVESSINTFRMYKNILITQGQIIAGKNQTGNKVSRNNDVIKKRYYIKKGWITPIFKIGCNFIFSKSIIEKVGLFDDSFGPGAIFRGAHDTEWGYRVLRAGFIVLFEPNIKLIHQSWRNKEEDLKQMTGYGFAAGAFLAKAKKKIYT